MISKLVDSKRAVAHIFNAAIAAPAIGTAWEIGLFGAVRDQTKVDVTKYAQEHDLDNDTLHGLVSSLAIVDVVELEHDSVVAGPLFDEAFKSSSLFHWLTLGSGELLAKMQYVIRNKNRVGDDYYTRDSAAIAYSCREINHQYFDPAFAKAMQGLDYNFKSVVDLGSGSGERLMRILDRYPGTTGIGVDIAAPAIKVAQAEAQERGLGNRLSFTVGDVRAMEHRYAFANVDLLTCFMMGHDFWPRENCVQTLRDLRKAFPRVRRFLLGDATRILLHNPDSKHAVTEDDCPIFTLGFEFGHAMMNVYLPTVEQWDGVFAEGGWRCVKKHLIPSLTMSVIFELEHADP